MHKNFNDRLLRALNGCNEGRPPVWLMRQAGRYMPEYRALRSKYSFLEMCHHPELIAEVTQLPIKVFGLDAAILFSDILVIPEALGVGLKFSENVGPIIERPLQTSADIKNLPSPPINEVLSYVAEGIKRVVPELEVPLIGFCGAPFTVASYMIEGGSSRDLKKTKQWMLHQPESFHQLLNKICATTLDYLHMQVDAGVDVIQVFDSWAHVLAHAQFREFSLYYFQKLFRGIQNRNIPVIFFCRGSSTFAPDLAELFPSAISLDWNADLLQVRRFLPQSIALQGNLDPDILFAPKAIIQKEILHLLNGMKNDPRYIFNLGHGIHPNTPPEAVKLLVETIKTFSL